jgi:ADP-L-glycero-D-manno-heptose 6-epimerase
MIVVTGGAGFIGSNVVAALTAKGDREVAICDVFGNSDKWLNVAKHELAGVISPPDLLDFLNSESFRMEAIIHLGAVTDTTETDVDLILRNNFKFSLMLWDWCARHEAAFIYASSAATYGDGRQGFEDSDSMASLARLHPLNPYGWSKHLFDRRVARIMAERLPAPEKWAGLKFFNVFGPNEYHKGRMSSVPLQVHDSILIGEPVRLFRSHNPDYEDGGQMRDFIYVEDCVAAIEWILDQDEMTGLYNMGTGTARSFLDMAYAVADAMGEELTVDWIDTPADIRDKYQYFTEAKMDRLREAGFSRTFTSLEDGVKRYVQQFLSKPDPYR